MTVTPDNDLTCRVIDCATEVHRRIGPGLSKDVYESCLSLQLTAAGLPFERGRVLPLVYDGHQLDFRCRTDFIVANSLVLQVEAVDEIDYTQECLLRTCVWMGDFPLGLLLNFNVVEMEDGVSRITSNAERRPAGFIFHDVFEGPEFDPSV
jgi:GxxExxY protein